MLASTQIGPETRKRIQARAIDLVQRIRNDSSPGMMELFLGEYGLSSDEGIALMCLAEALLRVPDGETMDALIEDKIAPSAWGQHLGKSNSSLVNASTWALFVTGKVLQEDQGNSIASILHSAIKRLGEPVIRQAVSRAMKEMGRQFVLGETIESAMERAGDMEEMGFTYSYDMLGEAARTEKDAHRYHLAYSEAISEIAKAAKSDDIRENPGISIKLSALHPRYETLQKQSVMDELVPRARSLAVLAKSAGIGLNIDAEEAGRLDLSLQVIETILQDPVFAGWDGFGVVVQAYGLRASEVLDWLYSLAERLDRKIMVRLVKGAYWDTEIKLSQVEGHDHFPVFTRKASTDVSYMCCAEKLLAMTDRIYPQFASGKLR
ncbi:MAG: proline dehydrogenase family protein, partial [Pseudomonadota bacterium]